MSVAIFSSVNAIMVSLQPVCIVVIMVTNHKSIYAQSHIWWQDALRAATGLVSESQNRTNFQLIPENKMLYFDTTCNINGGNCLRFEVNHEDGGDTFLWTIYL
jgi:hypothetical protein